MTLKSTSFATLFILSLSAPALAADEAACDRFVAAASDAGKRVGKLYPDAFLPLLKKGCLKATAEKVAKQTACVQKAKTEADMQGCNK